VREGSGSGSLPHNHSAGPRSSQVASHLATEISALADRHGFDWKAIGERGLAETPRGSGVEYEMTSFGRGYRQGRPLGLLEDVRDALQGCVALKCFPFTEPVSSLTPVLPRSQSVFCLGREGPGSRWGACRRVPGISTEGKPGPCRCP
jgi:hypothetical protein